LTDESFAPGYPRSIAEVSPSNPGILATNQLKP